MLTENNDRVSTWARHPRPDPTHFGIKLDTFTKAGAVLAGQDVDLPFL
jgi:hypothetical protein